MPIKMDVSFLEAALEGLEARKARMEGQIAGVKAMLGKRGRRLTHAEPGEQLRKRRQLSAAARKRIAAAQRKRWAEARKAKAVEVKPPKIARKRAVKMPPKTTKSNATAVSD